MVILGLSLTFGGWVYLARALGSAPESRTEFEVTALPAWDRYDWRREISARLFPSKNTK